MPVAKFPTPAVHFSPIRPPSPIYHIPALPTRQILSRKINPEPARIREKCEGPDGGHTIHFCNWWLHTIHKTLIFMTLTVRTLPDAPDQFIHM